MRVQLRPECWMLCIGMAPELTELVKGCEPVLEWAWRVHRRGTVEVDHGDFAA